VKSRRALAAFALSIAAFSLGCGYQVAGQSSILPKDVRTIAIAPWANASIQFTLSRYLAAAVSKEFIARSHYKVVSDLSKADVILYGTVANMTKGGTIYDNTVGKTVAGQVTVQIQYRLLDRAGKVLLSKPNMEFRERYEIATNPGQYFDESEVAMQRLSADVSRDLVSAILDQF